MSVFGPFLADGHNNDASIIKHIIKNDDQGIKTWLHDDDIIIVDRGFRDAVNSMEELGFQVKIPAFLKGKKQFSTQEANRNRIITKNRWIIENGIYTLFFLFLVPFNIFSKCKNQRVELFQLSSKFISSIFTR